MKSWEKTYTDEPIDYSNYLKRKSEEQKVTIIRVRRGINGFPYSACDANGFFIGNFEKLGDVRKHWLLEIRWGKVKLIRELDKQPDMSRIDETKEMLEEILGAYARKG
ncbi:MAG: hypothetical protein LUD69_04425 [Oscillospiraceae bacterium]|nr:hypothetical protein [Oscillospiraceae bacterium]